MSIKTSPSTLLQLQRVSKQFAGESILSEVDLVLSAGDAMALMGDSGSGKSTLLHMIAGLEPVDGGEIWLDHQPVHLMSPEQAASLRRHSVSLVFQQYNLIPTLSAQDNIRFPRRLLRMPETDDHLQLIIDRLQIADLLRRMPHQLSGGQQQRVAIARALAHKPRLLLADEPTGNLDEKLSHQVMGLLAELVQQTGTTLIMVTHSQAMAGYLPLQHRLHQGNLHALDPASVT